MPKWIYGTWQTTDGLEYMNISRDDTNLSIALWSDLDVYKRQILSYPLEFTDENQIL